MALTRVNSSFSFRSSDGVNTYTFDVSRDSNGVVSVHNLRTPTGPIRDTQTGYPKSVSDDISSAISQVTDLLDMASAINGAETLAGVSYVDVSFDSALQSDTYRVYVSIPDFVPYRVVNQTVSGFRIELGVSYTGDLSYDVFL